MAANPQPIAFAQWEAVTLTVTMSPPTSIAGWNFILNVRLNGGIALQSSAFTVTDAANGVFAFALASGSLAGQTGLLLPGIYDYDVWRTDAGFEAQLAFGQLTVESEQWK